MKPRRSVLWAVAIVALAFFAATAAAKPAPFFRNDRGYQRDLRKLATAARITSADDLFKGKLSFTKSRLSRSGAGWRRWGEGEKPFSVDLGNGCKVVGKVFKINLPMVRATKLKELKLVQGGRSTSLMPGAKVPILLDHSTDFWYEDNKITWNGPESRYAVLALFHELGHAKDFTRMTETQRQEFRTIYDRTSNSLTLTRDQHRKIVGFERSAWAHALRQAHRLKKMGFDVLGSPRREVMQTIYGSLRFYYDYKGTRDTMPRTRGWPNP